MISNCLETYTRLRWIKIGHRLSTLSHLTKFWTKFRHLIGKYQHTNSPLICNDQPLTSDQAKAFVEVFQTIFTPTATPFRTTLHNIIELLYTNQPPYKQTLNSTSKIHLFQHPSQQMKSNQSSMEVQLQNFTI